MKFETRTGNSVGKNEAKDSAIEGFGIEEGSEMVCLR